ncbi:ester hydrolase C11orf54 homolog isoform X4 [Centroberyx affinis]|uniref:ester hydrolase C11orf54 homolog isoform X4 n=1 Tax=Centroberyx affinis TaxID=166261 RepID=UPI003A5C3CA6
MAEISKTEKVQLHVPTLEELCGVLQAGLKDNFAEAQVSVVDCPDLTKQPFQFPVKGLCGKPRITDVGGVPYLVPLVQKDKEYNMNTVSKEVELPGAFILGAAAAPFRIAGMNAEVIEVRAKKRTGEDSLVGSLRKTLEGHYPDKSLALGGTFIIQKGKAKIHIMPREFSVCPLDTNDKVNNWLQHFEVSAPLICQSVLVSRDPGLDLRVEHTHCFSHHGEGGHYYIDTTPDSVEYLGYFMPAEFVYRIDRPKETHVIGRD